MPTLRMKNFRILKVEGDADKKANVGSYYVRADVYDPKNGTKEYNSINRFGEQFVNTIRACFPTTGTYIDSDGTEREWNGTNPNIPAEKQTRELMEQAIPITHKRIPNAMSVEVDLGGEFVRRRGRAGIDRDGNPYTADDFILDGDGTFQVYTTQRVLTSMEYEWGPATDANGNLIPNPKYDPNDPDCAEEEWLQTVLKDEHGVMKMHEAEGWESKPQADSIKRAFMVSVEKAIAECMATGKSNQVPTRYRSQNVNYEQVQQPPVGQTAQPTPAQAGQPQQQTNPNPQTAQPGVTVTPPF